MKSIKALLLLAIKSNKPFTWFAIGDELMFSVENYSYRTTKSLLLHLLFKKLTKLLQS